MKLFQYTATLLLAGLLACQKPTDAIKPADTTNPSDTTRIDANPSQGVILDKGTPMGQLIQKVIGPEGGTMASADGTLKMTIPAGAISKAIMFSMQPVTPTLPGLIGGQSFRLLPEGQTFAQPVTLQYHYNADRLDGTSTQALFMAYQDKDGFWNALPNTALDETAQTLTINTKHFSDWGAFAEYTLLASPGVVFPGQSTSLEIVGYGDELVAPLKNIDDAVRLAHQKTLANPGTIKNWKLTGKGNLNVGTSQVSATYSAPANLAKGSALVTVDIYNILPANQPFRKGSTGKAVLLKNIRIEGTFFRATIDGKKYDSNYYYGFLDPDDESISIGMDYMTDKSLSIGINSTELKFARYAYYSGQPGEFDGKAGAGIYDGVVYDSWYHNCNGIETTFSPGGVFIDAVDTINGETYVLGSFSGEVYHVTGGCTTSIQVAVKTFSAEFRVKLEKL